MRDFNDYLMESYELRENLVADKFRPRYHFVPPEGRWNDINGAIFWKGRYHLGYLQKIANGPGQLDFSSWQAHQQQGPAPLALPQGLAAGAPAGHQGRLLQQRRRHGGHARAHHHHQHAQARHLHLPVPR